MKPIVLASGSAIRAEILRSAGVSFKIIKPGVDEAAIKHSGAFASIDAMAQALADAKALAPDAPEAFVIGCDQILEFDAIAYDKPATMEDAAERLLAMQARAHRLVNGLCVAHEREIVFRHSSAATLHMRPMTASEIEDYLATAGAGVLNSVGAYQVEALGARLFERIDGDFFTVLGLPLFPLLGFLRRAGALSW
jgi:septum formation protein